MPISPEAPLRLSTMKFCPMLFWNWPAKIRPWISVPPPGGYGMIMRTDFCGHCWAKAGSGPAAQIAGALSHNLPVPPNEPYSLAHEIWNEKDSLLSKLMRERLADDTCEVNSRHHQAVKRVAAGFRISATAPDGVIEAIEDAEARFCLGVQWHPENFFRTGEFRPLFEAFMEACT